MKKKQEFYSKETLEIGIWEINLKTNTIFWNTITREIFEVADIFYS